MGLGLSLISKAPSESRKVLSKAFMVSALCFPTWLETAQQREKEKKKKKTYFPRETLSSRLRPCLPLHAKVRSSAHSFTLTNCSVNPGAGLPALPPSGNPIQPPRSESARHPPMFTHSSSFDIFLLPGSRAPTTGTGTEALLTALVSNSCLTQTFPAQGSV